MARTFQSSADARPYKVVDFKPLFAYLFPEEVRGYDWWGHADNDLVLGDIRHFLTQDLLSQYDVLSPMSGQGNGQGLLFSWGPLMFYRNTEKINELFRHGTHPLKDLIDTSDPHFLDEWGGGLPLEARERNSVWNSTMSGILTNHHERLGIRFYRGGGLSPGPWDGFCGANQTHCAECVLTWPPRSGPRPRLKMKSGDCNEDRCWTDAMLCHYQFGKGNLEASLVDPNVRQRIIQAGGLRVSFLEGFSPLGNGTPAAP